MSKHTVCVWKANCALRMEPECSFETSVSAYRTKRCHNKKTLVRTIAVKACNSVFLLATASGSLGPHQRTLKEGEAKNHWIWERRETPVWK
jgi:hypothetical protein